MSKANRFLTEIIKIIFKNLKCDLLPGFQRICFCFNLTVTFLIATKFFSVYLIIIWGKFNNSSSGPKYTSPFKFCVCLSVSMWICDLFCWPRYWVVNIKDSSSNWDRYFTGVKDIHKDKGKYHFDFCRMVSC